MHHKHRAEPAKRERSTIAPTPTLEKVPAAADTGHCIDGFTCSLSASDLQLSALDKALLQFQSNVMRRQEHSPHAIAASGIKGGGRGLPYHDKIQASFGKHDLSGVKTYTGQAATAAAKGLGARAYAMGDSVVLGPNGGDLHTVAHEAAHVIQQRGGVALAGGVGEAGDRYERHANAVADLVVQGKSAEGLLDTMAGSGCGAPALQREEEPASADAVADAPSADEVGEEWEVSDEEADETQYDPSRPETGSCLA